MRQICDFLLEFDGASWWAPILAFSAYRTPALVGESSNSMTLTLSVSAAKTTSLVPCTLSESAKVLLKDSTI